MHKTCKNCSAEFEIFPEDQEFYKKMDVPAPTICPECREQRRAGWRNERNLYYRMCNATQKKILSAYHPSTKITVYDNDYWYSDKWDGLIFGKNFDFSRLFLDQFTELFREVPQLARSATGNQNCDYVNQCGWCKNCYLIFEADGDEGCMYSSHIYDSRFCLDSSYITNSELCYECVDCQNCYDSQFLVNCQNCSESFFLQNCVGCKNCFGCVNLRNKQYYFSNETCTKEEYFQILQEVFVNQHQPRKEVKKSFFEEYIVRFPQKHIHSIQNEDSSGDYLQNTKNCQYSFDVQNSRDIKYVYDSRNLKNVYDMLVFGAGKGAEFCYEVHEIGDGVRNIFFSDQIWSGCHDIWYSKLCIQNSHNLFGCISLKHKSYCILNKQYSKEEYDALIPKIMEHMKKTGEFGEFFPISLSPFAYNETIAMQYYPLEKAEVLQRQWKWREAEEPNFSGITKKIPAVKLPPTIERIPDDILNWAIGCEESGKFFKIQKAELEFYRRMNLPIPHFHPDIRHAHRMALRNPRKLWDRNCMKCEKYIRTTYAQERPEIVYCESCYLKEVY
ncbi:zinc-ribbon domain containing protein [Candidatus Peregrinibacteria bacterium]|nr:zinc-ribbon domain containing protein [Candidatus Peregrinibacteria bacterium]